jgi:hypothetical protein
MDEAELLEALGRACPDNEDLPNPGTIPLNRVFRAAMDRDSYTCCYPGCSARAKLHPHHIAYRSRFGGKSQRQCHSLSNICTVCVFHHRQLHAGVIGVTGKAPFDLEWRKPKLTETAMMRMERRRMETARRRKKRQKSRPEPETEVQTFAVGPEYVIEDETYDFKEVIAELKAGEDELKEKGALRMDAQVDWDALTLEDISPDELEFLLQTFALDGAWHEEAFGVAH